jgi:hypothetical protein
VAGGYPTIYLCDGCAEKRDGDVTYLSDLTVWEEVYCEDCGSPNLAAEEEQERVAETYRQGTQRDVLQELGVVRWEEISNDFKQADLLLGNNFSLNFSQLFNYDSLFENFLRGFAPDEAKVFRRFETTNFEHIQEQLLDAKKVNKIFGLPTQPIDAATRRLSGCQGPRRPGRAASSPSPRRYTHGFLTLP